tara:strand:+ start:2943 stop:3362 length:420 start_codon:yes stop_codon:yes gene_type:complete
MSRRTDLLQKLVQSNRFGQEKEQEQNFLIATAELILSDLIEIALKGIESRGPGSLVINLLNDSSVYMAGADIEGDLLVAESHEDEDVIDFLRPLINEVDTNDWSKYVLITLISDAGTRTFAVEAGGSQESLRAFASEFT